MKQKKWYKKAVSGILAAVTLLTSLIAPIPAMAAETTPEDDLDAALEASEGQETYDWESGLTLSGVLIWATEEEGIDLVAMDEGSTVGFTMPRMKAARVCI